MHKLIFLTVLFSLSFSNFSEAKPIYYTFDMQFDSYWIDKCYQDSEYSCSSKAYEDSGLYQLAPVSYTFVVDYNSSGQKRHQNGDIEYIENSFFIDYVGGDAFGYAFENDYDGYYASYGYFEGVDVLNVGSINNSFHAAGFIFSQLAVGDSLDQCLDDTDGFHFRIPLDNGTGWVGTDNGDVVVTDISSTNPFSAVPVPEPSTVLLFGSGLAGLFVCRRKAKR